MSYISHRSELFPQQLSAHTSTTPVRWISLLFALWLVLISTVGTANAGLGLTPPSNEPDYSWTLKSGLYSIGDGESLRVLVTEITHDPNGVAAVVRFYDHSNTLIGGASGVILPNQPLVADFVNGGPNSNGNPRLVRLEIDLITDNTDVIPVSTVEFDRPGDLVPPSRYSCSGPSEVPPVNYNCEEPGSCPPRVTFVCPELVVFDLVLED